MNGPQNFSMEQQAYLQGILLGTDVARKVRELPVLSDSLRTNSQIANFVIGATTPANQAPNALLPIHAEAQQQFERTGKKLVAEEIAKRDKAGLEMWHEIASRSEKGEFPKGTDVFMSKYYGMFYVAPAQNSFMCRMRIPGGVLRANQLEGIADLSDQYANGKVDITTRANLQLREINANNPMHILQGLRDLGIVTTGAGADNIRNVTCSTLSGIDSNELMETLDLAKKLHYYILHKPELYGLPRKFNIAFDGSGRISCLAETNDISWHAVNVSDSTGLASDICCLLGLGGITGHGDFARSTGIVAKPSECIAISEAILRVYIKNGNRTDRKKARLKYLLDEWGFEKFLVEVEAEYGHKLTKVASENIIQPNNIDRWAHVDFHEQKQLGMYYVGVVVPVGKLTTSQCRALGRIARLYGNGTIRLTVWQNLIIPNIKSEDIELVKSEIEACGLGWNASSFRAGLVACTGSAGCKYAGADTKANALFLAEYLEERFELDSPINIHLTGCHHSCAQHAIGDIGLIATKVSSGDDMIDGYHILLGGRTGINNAIGTMIFDSVPFKHVPFRMEEIINHYLANRTNQESFCDFSSRVNWSTFLPSSELSSESSGSII